MVRYHGFEATLNLVEVKFLKTFLAYNFSIWRDHHKYGYFFHSKTSENYLT